MLSGGRYSYPKPHQHNSLAKQLDRPISLDGGGAVWCHSVLLEAGGIGATSLGPRMLPARATSRWKNNGCFFGPVSVRNRRLNLTPNKRMALLALLVLVLDQASKLAVLAYLGRDEERVVIDGFFKLVHLVNTGAAWSLFRDNNELLAIVALLALLVLFLVRHRFDIHTRLGWISLGLMFGGIVGNLVDRLLPSRHHVIDFLYFYVKRGGPAGRQFDFPAFNVADSAICIGVGLLFILSFQKENGAGQEAAEVGGSDPNQKPGHD
jgi:signal peptidase II